MSVSTWARHTAIIKQSRSTRWPWCGWVWCSSGTARRVHYWTRACNYVSLSRPILFPLLSLFIDKLLCNCGFHWTCANSNALYYCRLVWEGKWECEPLLCDLCDVKWSELWVNSNKQRNPKRCECEYRFLVLKWRVLWGHNWKKFYLLLHPDLPISLTIHFCVKSLNNGQQNISSARLWWLRFDRMERGGWGFQMCP